MPPSPQRNGQQRENGPSEVSPPSSDADNVTLHESWLSGRFNQPAQQNHDQQIQNNQGQNQQHHDQQFAPNWPFAPVALADLINQRPSMVVPPNNTPVVTPEGSLKDASLEESRTVNDIRQEGNQHDHHDHYHDHQHNHHRPQNHARTRQQQQRHNTTATAANGELERSLQASNAQLARPAPAEQPRPSSFEIMGCVFPNLPRPLQRPNNNHAYYVPPGPSRRNDSRSRFGSNRVPTPYPSGAFPPKKSSADAQQTRLIQRPGITAGSQRPSYEHCGTRRLVVLVVASGSTIASFVLLTQAVSVMTIFRAANRPVSPGYIVECVLSLIILLLSTAALILVSVGRDFVFPYTLRSPFARRQPPQPKEFELGGIISRPANANNQDIERGGVQHQGVPRPAAPIPIQGPAESRVLLLQPATSNATMAPSTTQTSIVTELCDAVTTPNSRS